MSGFDANWYRRFRRNLLRWYARHARDLPWRRTRNAYHVWISEIMLQQTTVAAVEPYYRRFLSRFPTLGRLAAAPEDEVLKLWEGLGYYSRARNIHKATQRVVDQHSGRLPDDLDELQKLPGIGRYTAGAIASFAFDRRAPIIEANTLRLHSRLLGLEGDPRSSAGQQRLWEFADRVLPRKEPGRFNQALMELGAMVCTPREPRCAACPVKSCCEAFASGRQDEIPPPAKRPQTTDLTEAAVAVCHEDCFLLRRCETGERWAGLWDFPRFSLTNGVRSATANGRAPAKLKAALERNLQASTGIAAEIDRLLTELTHGVTRYRIRLLCYLAVCDDSAAQPPSEQTWVHPADFSSYPLSTTGRKIANLLSKLDF